LEYKVFFSASNNPNTNIAVFRFFLEKNEKEKLKTAHNIVWKIAVMG